MPHGSPRATPDEAVSPHHLAPRPRRSLAPYVGPVAGMVGIAVPAVGLTVVPIWDFPATTASGAEVARWVAVHQGPLQTTMLLNTVGVTLWLVFGAAVHTRLRRVGADETATTCFIAGLAGFVTLLLAGFTAFDVLVLRTPDAATSRLLYDLTFGLLAMSGMPTAVALAAYAVSVRHVTDLPPSTAWLAGIAALAHVALLGSFVAPRGPLSLEGPMITVVPGFLWLWILVTALALARPSDYERLRVTH